MRAVLFALRDADGYVPSHEIAEEIGYTQRTVLRVLSILIKEGRVIRRERMDLDRTALVSGFYLKD